MLILNAFAFRIIHLELLLFLKELYVVRYSLFYQVVLLLYFGCNLLHPLTSFLHYEVFKVHKDFHPRFRSLTLSANI